MPESDIFAGRSVHGAPLHARNLAAHPVLRIAGEVANARQISAAEIRALPHTRYLDLAIDRESTFLPNTNWSGVWLQDLLALCAPAETAHWARVSAGPYAFVLPSSQFATTLLCDLLDGEPIPVEKGGPWRLVNPDARYNMSVKWVDTILLSEDEPDNSAERIAAARRRAREAKRDRG